MNCSSVLPNLLVGPDPRYPEDFRQLKKLRVSAILSLQADDEIHSGGIGSQREAAESAGLEFRSLPVTDFDRAELQEKLPACVSALAGLIEAGHTVYLHCAAGVNRSPTVAAAYLHWRLAWPLEQAVAHLQAVRNCCPDRVAIGNAAASG